MPTTRQPTFFLSHGGGPWPWMRQQMGTTYDVLHGVLTGIPAALPSPPRAVLMVSGHWEHDDFAVMASPSPAMLYDYGGFPAHTYQVRYDAPGMPELAGEVHDTLRAAGLPSSLDATRGYDHGSFVPMAVMYPDANVPMLQLSIRQDYDPAAHLAAGAALAPLRDQGVLVVASGLSFHDMRNMGARGRQASATFDRWLDDTLVHASPQDRRTRLLDWASAPAARQAHPREDHLIPLLVAVGAAGDDPGTRIHHEEDFLGGLHVSSFRFG